MKKEGFIMHSYTAKYKSTNDYKIKKLTKLMKPINEKSRHGITIL